MLNFKNEYTQGFVVFSDDDTWESLDGTANVVLVDGEFNTDADKCVRGLLRAYSDARDVREKQEGHELDPMDDVTVETEDCTGEVRVRAISIAYLLRFYLEKSACTQ
jgi:hypothetical protein